MSSFSSVDFPEDVMIKYRIEIPASPVEMGTLQRDTQK